MIIYLYLSTTITLPTGTHNWRLYKYKMSLKLRLNAAHKYEIIRLEGKCYSYVYRGILVGRFIGP